MPDIHEKFHRPTNNALDALSRPASKIPCVHFHLLQTVMERKAWRKIIFYHFFHQISLSISCEGYDRSLTDFYLSLRMVGRMIPGLLSHPTNPASCDVTDCLPWLGELLDLVDPGGLGGTSYCMIFMQFLIFEIFSSYSSVPFFPFYAEIRRQVKNSRDP